MKMPKCQHFKIYINLLAFHRFRALRVYRLRFPSRKGKFLGLCTSNDPRGIIHFERLMKSRGSKSQRRQITLEIKTGKERESGKRLIPDRDIKNQKER